MCGIIGHVVSPGQIVDSKAVEQGSQVLQHRGPDQNGLLNLPQACLAHRRLSIIDLESSSQPWSSPCGRYHIVFNGEIYNFQELRQELTKEGFSFRTNGDTEVLLNMYIARGKHCVDKLNGMFAFAVWDSRQRCLFMARDRIGKKPLYYAEADGQLAFASELGSLGCFGFIDKSINTSAINDFFAHQFIGEERTIYTRIHKLLPAHCLTWKDGKITISQYWHVPHPAETDRVEADLHEELRSLITDAIGIRLRSDVPLGAFLSGGLDSTLIAANIRQQGYPLSTYTIGFEDQSFDESSNAKRVAEALKTNHFMQRINISNADVINRCLDAFNEPFADPSAIPTWYLCKYASRYVTVALSGDGVDELFAGYRRYYARQLAMYFGFCPVWFKNHVIGSCIQALPESSTYYSNSVVKKIKLFYALMRRMDESPGDPLAQTFTHTERQQLFQGTEVNIEDFNYLSKFKLGQVDPVSAMMMADQQTYLPEDILTKVDRMSMQHGLEVRSPFLDYRIIDFIGQLPLRFKIKQGKQKYLLRKCYAGSIPDFVLKRQKHGFAVPLADWFRGPLYEPFEQLVLDSGNNNFLNRTEVMRLWREHLSGRIDHGFKLWSIYVFCRWHYNQVSI